MSSAPFSVPTIVVSGFLDAGKTHFLNEAIGEQTFIDYSSRGIILCCEEGEEEYDMNILKANHVSICIIPKEELFSEDTKELIKNSKMDVVYIEQNAMWGNDPLPEYFSVQQTITIVDASTFKVYFNNMRQMFVDILSKSDVVIMYHCDNEKEASSFKRNMQLINRNLQFLMFDSNDKAISPEDDLPYSINGDKIQITDDTYGVWFFEINDNPERYNGKKVVFSAQAMLDNRLPRGFFIAGRRCMTCCANDIQDLFNICDNNTAKKSVTNGSWVSVYGTIKYKVSRSQESMPYIDVIDVVPIAPPKDEIIGLQG